MRIEALDIRKLIAFRLVAKSGNLRQAAVRINQTVPAISSKIRRLEEDLGIELFERLPNRIVLTAKGERFLVEVEAFIARGEQALATLAAAEEPSGRLSVSIGSDHSWYFAPKISQFLKRFPDVELSLEVCSAAEALRSLGRGELDVSIGIFPKLPPAFEQEVVVESSLALVCPAGHPLLRRQPPSLSEIARYRLISLPRHAETRKLVDRGMRDSAVKAKSVIEVANCQTAGTFVQMGVGVAIVHSLCIGHAHSENLRWVDLGQHFGSVSFSIVSRKGTIRSPLIGEFIEELSK